VSLFTVLPIVTTNNKAWNRDTGKKKKKERKRERGRRKEKAECSAAKSARVYCLHSFGISLVAKDSKHVSLYY
jgi:hypothetical protein